MLSVLPLHHTFELTCGLLLPLSRGARVVYLDELNAERSPKRCQGRAHHRHDRRARAVGDARAPDHGADRRARPGRGVAVRLALELNRAIGQVARRGRRPTAFGPVHQALGGNLRFLVSGGAALPERTHQLFARPRPAPGRGLRPDRGRARAHRRRGAARRALRPRRQADPGRRDPHRSAERRRRGRGPGARPERDARLHRRPRGHRPRHRPATAGCAPATWASSSARATS